LDEGNLPGITTAAPAVRYAAPAAAAYRGLGLRGSTSCRHPAQLQRSLQHRGPVLLLLLRVRGAARRGAACLKDKRCHSGQSSLDLLYFASFQF